MSPNKDTDVSHPASSGSAGANPSAAVIELEEIEPGLYTLPQIFGDHSLHMSDEFKAFGRQLRARRSLIEYVFEVVGFRPQD